MSLLDLKSVKSNLIFGEKQKDVLLSIVIPTYRVNEFCIQALKSAINQKNVEMNYEIIVVINDPNFNDYGIFPCDSKVLIYQNEVNIGMKANIDRCAELANGKYISFLHDDDLLLDNFIFEITKYLSDTIACIIPSRYIVYSSSEIGIRAKKNTIKKERLSHLLFYRYLYRRKVRKITINDNFFCFENCYNAPSCGTTFLKNAFLKYGGFNSSNSEYSFDFDFFLKFNIDNDIIILNEYLGIYRMVDSASNKSKVQYSFWKFCSSLVNDYDNKFLIKYRNEILFYIYNIWNSETKQMILSDIIDVPQKNNFKYLCFRIKRVLYKYNHNLDITKLYRKEI